MPLTKTDNSAMTLDERRTVQQRLVAHGIDPGPVDGIIGHGKSSERRPLENVSTMHHSIQVVFGVRRQTHT